MTEQVEKSDNDPEIEETEETLPGNSMKGKIVKSEEEYVPNKRLPITDVPQGKKKLKRVVHGRLLRKKRSLGKSLMQTFFGEDTKSVGSYILWDVLIPAAKNTIQEMVGSGVEMLLFGEARGSRRRDRDRGRSSTVSYNSFYHKDRERNESVRDHRRYARPSSRYDFDEIIFENGEEAADVLGNMEDLIRDYEQASVADFYELAGLPDAQFTDEKWGWTDLARTRVRRVRNGYIIDLPRPIEIDS